MPHVLDIFAVLALSSCLAAAEPAAVQMPQSWIVCTEDEVLCKVKGSCGDEVLVRLAEKSMPLLKLNCTLHPRDGSGQRSIEPKPIKASFDLEKQRAVVEYDVGVLAADYKLKDNRLECRVSLRNKSNADMEFAVCVLTLKTLLNYWNCEGQWFGTSWGFSAPGCKVGVFVQGDFSGEYRKCYTDQNGFTPLCVKNRPPRTAKHPVVDSALLSDPGTLVAPGATVEFKVCLVFAREEATDMELFAQEFREMGQKRPMALKWADRRPIGTAFIAQAGTGWSGNPRGYIVGLRDKEDIHSQAGLAAFGKRLLEYADQCIVELKDKNAQGVIVWDLEGQEKPHSISYVGDPRKLPQVAPEMDRFADAFMKKFSDAGFRTGVTLRPTDYYDAAPGKRNWTHREVKDPVALMSEKIQYAKQRWGTTIFYLDSNVFNQDWGKFPEGANVPWTMPTRMIERLQEAHPDCLVIPEWSNADYYRWSAPYSSQNLGQLTTNARNPFARVQWPGAFGVVAVETNLLETCFGTYVEGVAGGDVLLFRCWYHDAAAEMVKRIYHEADMKRKLAGQPAGDLFGLITDAASNDEVRCYASARGLASHTEPGALEAAAVLLDDASISVRRAALEAIKAQGKVASPRVIDKLVAMLKADAAEARLLRQSVAEALAAQGEAAVPAMRVLLKSGAADVRLYAVRCLGQSGTCNPAAAEALLELFGKSELANDRDLRESVILGLGRMKATDALPALLALLSKDEGREREWVRVAAITALGDLGDQRAVGPLIAEYKHGYSNVQVYVFRACLYEALTKLTGQKNAVWPDYNGWKKWLEERKKGKGD